MKLQLPKPGAYVIAVSGGIDSVCLLNIMAQLPDYQLIVAHYDHGIRSNSGDDRQFVAELAGRYNLCFKSAAGHLGPGTSEAIAREARYRFLKQVAYDSNSTAIITAHHLDDRLETIIINLIRGTGRKGLSSLNDSDLIKRPLINVSKATIRRYVIQHNLSWREDSTNYDDRYLRNYIRLHIVPRLTDTDRERLIDLSNRQQRLNEQIDESLKQLLVTSDNKQLDRRTLTKLGYNESKELIASWLRANNLINFDRKTIERLVVTAKTKRSGTRINVIGALQMTIGKDYLALNTIER